MQTANINIELPRSTQIEVENYCHEKGISFSQYFQYLHRRNMKDDEHAKQLIKTPTPDLRNTLLIDPSEVKNDEHPKKRTTKR